MLQIKGRVISRGRAKGEALVSSDAISFLGGVDPKTGVVIEKGHSLEGKSVAGKILVFPVGKGSTVGSYVMLQLKRNGMAPAGIINVECEPIVAVGAIISGIPLIDKLEKGGYDKIKDGSIAELDADKGLVLV